MASYFCTMSDIELRLAERRDRGVSGGDNACWASAAAASDEEATPPSAALDLDAETGTMNIDAGRERPVANSGDVGEVAEEPPGRVEGEGAGFVLLGDDGRIGCGEDDLGLVVSGGGFIVVAGTMTELLLVGAVGSVGLFALPPHRSTMSCTELCRLLLFVRLRL